jgi:serine/threonine-protein kinase HipA
LKKDEKWQLAPAYDICFAYDPTNIWVSQQTLSINGKRNNISKEDFLSIAKANNIKRGEDIIDDINNTVSNWKDFADKAKVDEQHFDHIKRNLHTF